MSFSFTEEGVLAVKPKVRREHLPLLRAVDELPFGVGKKLLLDHLRGVTNAKTTKLRLDRYTSFGELGGFQEEELAKLVGFVLRKGFITTQQEKSFYYVYALTPHGKEELLNPSLTVSINELSEYQETTISNPFKNTSSITDDDRKLFAAINDFFPHLTEEQKKAVTSPASKLLCVAGAGSGKTTVLATRADFLVKYRGATPHRVLAITFTRKARTHMKEALEKKGLSCQVETFNSFCEKLLREHMPSEQRVISPREQINLLVEAIKSTGREPYSVINEYYTPRQRQGKDDRSLFFSFSYDFNSFIERLKLTNTSLEHLRTIVRGEPHAKTALLLLDIAQKYLQLTNEYRDYADQIINALELLEQQPHIIQRFEHILVDEYQDVNDQQLRLLNTLRPNNLFVVGDPRQSIYGWRGAKIRHLLNFTKHHSDAQVVELTKNFRSDQAIVDVCNELAKKTSYQPLHSSTDSSGIVTYNHYASEEEQAARITRRILEYEGDRKDIFVLSRTNKGLKPFQDHFSALNIPYLLRTEELKRTGVDAKSGQVTLATVHAIKGLEASIVYAIGVNTTNYPCKAQDHPVMELFHLNEEYDSYAEELRVLYVALSRAEHELHISWTGKLSPFLPSREQKTLQKTPRTLPSTTRTALVMKLKKWRYHKAKEQGCPAYVVFTDKTLEALIDLNPSCVDDLFSVPGLGQHRIEAYGDELIDALQE